MKNINALISIAKRKHTYDQTNSWYSGSSTYLSEIQNEINEVIEEIPRNRLCFLEDELGDILWNYLNILLALETETGVKPETVLNRAVKKYEERITTLENGGLWNDIKEKQKLALLKENSQIDSSTD